MKYIVLITSIIAFSVVTGCGSGSSEDKAEPATIPVPASTSSSTQTNTTVPTNTIPAATAPVINTTQQPIKPSPTTVALNPAHGQPGHLCEIAVGAPLDSKPTQPVATIQQPTINGTTKPSSVVMQPNSVQSTKTASTATGLNPEHGKPGHRCDISVGAPLDSKPIQQPTVTTTQASQNPLPFTPLVPAVNKPAASTTATTGINPAHGQPGHRCDIAVGASLNSKPTQSTIVQQPGVSTTTPAVKPKTVEEKIPEVSKPKQQN